ncbi:MAG TPA: type II toxin-antitoxin system prevent-host-death family antitoxin [Rhizomicrobium sp.]|jgi:prevent-host-death family protein|nr:type II toxin-antitoxin system prevent-host-death family antitoxin [Rhizomicrobium sp.]
MDRIWPVQDAKARLSELLRAAEHEPQQISFRGEPKFEVRLLPEARKKKTDKSAGLPRWWLDAPTVPEFKAPPRKREKPRKIF